MPSGSDRINDAAWVESRSNAFFHPFDGAPKNRAGGRGRRPFGYAFEPHHAERAVTGKLNFGAVQYLTRQHRENAARHEEWTRSTRRTVTLFQLFLRRRNAILVNLDNTRVSRWPNFNYRGYGKDYPSPLRIVSRGFGHFAIFIE
jgi:hypothetical protein